MGLTLNNGYSNFYNTKLMDRLVIISLVFIFIRLSLKPLNKDLKTIVGINPLVIISTLIGYLLYLSLLDLIAGLVVFNLLNTLVSLNLDLLKFLGSKLPNRALRDVCRSLTYNIESIKPERYSTGNFSYSKNKHCKFIYPNLIQEFHYSKIKHYLL